MIASVLLCQGTALHLPLKDASVHCVVTSPPYYGLRSYGIGEGELGLESTPQAYIAAMVQVFREVWRVLRPEGTLWLNMGDSYNAAGRNGHGTRIGYKQGTNRASATGQDACRPTSPRLGEKQLLGMPWRVAFALQADGWVLRSDIIWDKPSCMPESVQDRPTRSHEYVFLFSKQARYFYDAEAIREPGMTGYSTRSTHLYSRAREADPRDARGKSMTGQPHADDPTHGRNARTVWIIPSEPFSGSHFATFPSALVRRCLLAGAPTQVCAACGAPWVRETAHTFRPMTDRSPEKLARASGRKGIDASRNDAMQLRGYSDVATLGFAPPCTCTAASVPATVLDPFCGSGTTLLVARELGHHAIGLDLSSPYLHDIARERLWLKALDAWTHGQGARAVRFDDLPLFAAGYAKKR